MYEFLSEMRRPPGSRVKVGLFENAFFPVEVEQIREAEKELGSAFPFQLERFFLEVGWGRLQTGTSGKQTSSFNDVASPGEIVQLLHGTSQWLMPYSQLEPNTLPFFQRDTDLFLCLHPSSDGPNAVWWMWGELVCPSLVEFFEKLHRDPNWFSLPRDH